MKTFRATVQRTSAFELRKLYGRNFPGGVQDTVDRLSKKQAEGWLSAKSIHPDADTRARRRDRNRRTLPQRLAAQVARSQRDQEFRLGRKKG